MGTLSSVTLIKSTMRRLASQGTNGGGGHPSMTTEEARETAWWFKMGRWDE
jgi:hypothetical protein